jgi:hypothetical protein
MSRVSVYLTSSRRDIAFGTPDACPGAAAESSASSVPPLRLARQRSSADAQGRDAGGYARSGQNEILTYPWALDET